MIKGLEIINLYEDSNYLNTFHPNFMKDLQIVKKELQRLESIDNAKPSEALNYLDQFINEMTRCLENPKQYAKNYDKEIFYKYKYTFETTIKQALLKSQEQEKVLEILFEKNVDIFFIKSCKTIEQYNLEICKNSPFAYGLTQEEFDLLKRWVECQKN